MYGPATVIEKKSINRYVCQLPDKEPRQYHTSQICRYYERDTTVSRVLFTEKFKPRIDSPNFHPTEAKKASKTVTQTQDAQDTDNSQTNFDLQAQLAGSKALIQV